MLLKDSGAGIAEIAWARLPADSTGRFRGEIPAFLFGIIALFDLALRTHQGTHADVHAATTAKGGRMPYARGLWLCRHVSSFVYNGAVVKFSPYLAKTFLKLSLADSPAIDFPLVESLCLGTPSRVLSLRVGGRRAFAAHDCQLSTGTRRSPTLPWTGQGSARQGRATASLSRNLAPPQAWHDSDPLRHHLLLLQLAA